MGSRLRSSLALLLAAAAPSHALDHCVAGRKGLDGEILVSARNVSGALLWGDTAGTETNPFHNASTCVTGAPLAAKACLLGPSHSPLATTPPAECVLHLKDGAGTCAATVKDCTPGVRPRVVLPSRFVDHGDGTVTDTKTGLMWEQKSFDATPPDPAAIDTGYSWTANPPSLFPDGTVFTDFLARRNGIVCSSAKCQPLGGHTDWRLPTLDELQSIGDVVTPACVIPGALPKCNAPIFGGLSINGFDYWSASTSAADDTKAWSVKFGGSPPVSEAVDKGETAFHARAVRGSQ